MQRARPLASYHDTARRGTRAALPLSLALLTAGLAGPWSSAQTAAPPPQSIALSPEAIRQRSQELDAARAEQSRAAETQAKLRAEIAAIGQDRAKLNQQLIDSAAQVRGLEDRMAAAETRLHSLDARDQDLHSTLNSRRAEVVEVLAALQRAGRRTPPALLVRPEDALQSLRTAMLLGAVVPELRARAQVIANELGELLAVRKAITGERDRLAADRDRFRDDQNRLAALIDERQRQQMAKENDMAAESARAIALSKQVDDLQGLIARMEQDVKTAAKAAAIASQQGAPVAGDPAQLKNARRTSPAIAFASAKGLFTFPVSGNKIREFGSSDGAGGIEKGISLASRPGAQVTTPCDGWVVYAGPFRSYGQLLILNAGGGYHVLIAGMERISVNIGQFVQTGEPVATMGRTSQVASIFAPNVSQPVLYVEFRKDGTPIDPGPWWASKEGEKVRG